jgi:hypothetical protein
MIKPLAIYLPQFHPIPENDEAWGKGFTEWTNVKKAQPLFEGHYQPHIPHESIGYYDLRDPEVLVKQAAMAKEYGIYGFAYYHYWFNGKRLLNTPIDNMLKLGKPDFPFCLIWANEPWSKRWDGSENEIIQKQNYSSNDDLIHIKFLCESFFCDKRYIKIDNKPVFLVYRTEILPNSKKTSEIWREEVRKYGFDDIFLVRVENFQANVNPKSVGFDCALEFAPDWRCVEHFDPINSGDQHYNLKASYVEISTNMMMKKYDYKAFRCVFPSWDNSPRKKSDIRVFSDGTPQLFAYFFNKMVSYTKKNFVENEQFLFINSWNEWGESCHIEPDLRNGYSFLEGIKKALSNHPIQAPLEYIRFIEKRVIEQKDKIDVLQNECDKYRGAYLSNDYKIGRMLIYPLRLFKRKIMKRF